MKKIEPFLKWAGGKRWFVHRHTDFLPKQFDRYIEPFLGSGAVFFHLKPENALLGDSNLELINCYQAIQQNWKLVYRYLREHHRNHSKEYYYKIRSFKPKSIFTAAARFIYLNRTCWNGLYRVNKQGEFNVPIGTKTNVIFKDDCFEEIYHLLQKVQLLACDFEYLLDQAVDGDLVFVDPPYTVRHNHNGFIKYNERIFSWHDQERLYYALTRAQARGAMILGTNAYHQCVKDLYFESFDTMAVSRNSPISSKVESRRQFEELIIFSKEITNGK